MISKSSIEIKYSEIVWYLKWKLYETFLYQYIFHFLVPLNGTLLSYQLIIGNINDKITQENYFSFNLSLLVLYLKLSVTKSNT